MTTSLHPHNLRSTVESFLHERDIDELRQIHAEYVRPLTRGEMIEQLLAIEQYLIERLHDREALCEATQAQDEADENSYMDRQR